MITLGPWLLASLVAAAPARAEASPRRTTLFLDFGGGPVGPGPGPGAASCVTAEFAYPSFLGSERAAELALGEARRLLAPYGVRVVGQPPPPWLSFTHVRIGGDPAALGLDEELNGLACNVDCDDETRDESVFMFSDKWIARVVIPELEEDQLAVQVGRIAVHEAAHSWGLEHTGGSESIMARFPTAAVPSFVEGCQSLDLDGEPECPAPHARHCGADEQDAHAELLALFGDGSPDTAPPQAEIAWPPDGLVVRPGDTVEVQIEVSDDHQGVGWMLEVPELGWQHLAPDGEPATLPLTMPAGRWTLHLEAVDHDRNVTEVEIHVEARPEAEVASPPPGPQAACACRSSAGAGGLVWWLWPLLAVRRRGRAIVRPS